jgi:hypothetical protein
MRSNATPNDRIEMNAHSGSETAVEWYSVRCVFRSLSVAPKRKQYVFEERIMLWQADSPDAAVAKSEAEAARHAEATDSEYLGIAQACRLRDDEIADGTEVFSLMRESDYSPPVYVDVYFDDGFERQQT